MANTSFRYVYTATGSISGASVLRQTEDAINQVGSAVVDAVTDSKSAVLAAEEARSTANTANSNSIEALRISQSVETRISGVESEMSDWGARIQQVTTTAGTALSTANTANSNAQKAVTTANSANSTAKTASTTAEEAKAIAEEALSTAQSDGEASGATAQQALTTAQQALATAEQARTDAAADIATMTGLVEQAQNSATQAQTQAQDAQGYVTKVQTYAETAEKWATSTADNASEGETPDYTVDEVEYSAKWRALEAKAWATKMDGMVTEDNLPDGTAVDYSAKYYAAQAKEAVATNFEVQLASLPRWYRRPSLMTSAKTSVTIPAGTQVNIGGSGYVSTAATTLQLSTVGEASARAGKDVYVYACQPSSGTVPAFVLSMNSTVPTGYSASNSRKIGGFHCLCVAAGTIAGNAASGYAQGDIIPGSVWDLLYRAESENEGMVYVEDIGEWVDIYLPSWSGSQLQSVYGGTIVDGTSAKPMHGETFVEQAAKVKKHLLSRAQFMAVADTGNQMTQISTGKDPVTTGGHTDTAGRRIITADFVEDCAGVLWQWVSDIFGAFNNTDTATANSSQYLFGGISNVTQAKAVEADESSGVQASAATDGSHYLMGYQWQVDGRGTTNLTIDGDLNVKGIAFGALGRALVGGRWDDWARCGSRSVRLYCLSSHRFSGVSARCGSRPRVVSL